MAIRLFCILAALFFSSAAQACDLSPETRPTRVADFAASAFECLHNPPDGYRFEPELEADFIRLVNDTRQRAGLAPLDHRPELVQAARYHSLDMTANAYFRHEGLRGRNHADRIAALDRRLFWQAARENLAKIEGRTNKVAELLHDSLMDSPSHRANILARNVDHIAVGVTRRGKEVLVTQLFVAEAGALSADAPLRLAPDEPFRPFVMLDGYRFAGFRADAGEETFIPFTAAPDGRWLAPPEIRGDAVIEARGEQAGAHRGVISYIYLRGPAFSLNDVR